MNPVPIGVLYDAEHGDFYSAWNMASMGKEFRRSWILHANFFPQIIRAIEAKLAQKAKE